MRRVIVFLGLIGMLTLLPSVQAVTPEGDGEVFWCSPEGYSGYYLTYWTVDNLLDASVTSADVTALRGYGWVNGGMISTAALATSHNGPGWWDYTTSGSLPRGSIVAGPQGDGSFLIIPASVVQPSFVACCTAVNFNGFQYILNIANSNVGHDPYYYPHGFFAYQAGSRYDQSGQITPAPGQGTNFAPPPQPSTPPQTIGTIQANLSQTAPQPFAQQSSPPQTWVMWNTAIAIVQINGQSLLSLPVNTPINVTVTVNAPGCQGYGADYWVASQNQTNGTAWWFTNNTWVKSPTALIGGTGGLANFSNLSVFNGTLQDFVGTWAFYFCVDMRANGVLDNPLMCSNALVTFY